ncbi:dihydroflavonol-4-reductase [Dyadobacter sp. BE34]|uniref:Dihydroflavonol-4-reductase n=1 Tax=Dyadobacter fermentans TaxID=94254 RepID=A0ABU1QU64_9BACT|nr:MULTISPECIES: NAD-dependent epimerase/dehydratase family protein [Dyadobacter]MDR6804689.1 dihydroflavonol-4-reductase [Dyadobacter fermentans]MDR7043552.1 dihydroflavonol-4-reductase [Dyadobacter sp. BE242]MDR7197864.1 dihydroflavonol-4-reductase [Dyadobacter sp. BE34]MDR7214703.1 dihydroflavonol-4-reductase [Dyadobacter sp. BE31]MDR7262238.1 dihydroflavonol-4-reductase [Dyadobacter sp. BE32]
MGQKNLALVSGANGHLGNNLVRLLISKGIPVRASIRNIENKASLSGMDCEVVQADITDKASLAKALEGVEVFYAVGAAFKLWARDPQKEIYDVNLNGTRNMIEAAAEMGVKRIVYVSSVAALNYSKLPTKERYGYNPERRDMYYNSKNDGEQLAFRLADELGVELVAVLPSAMIGGDATLPLNVSYGVLKLILNKQIPVDTKITLNWIDVRDVAQGCYLAAQKGLPGERYILANEQCMSITHTTRLASRLYPELNLKVPGALPRFMLLGLAAMMELSAKFSGKAPLLTRKDIKIFSGLQQNFDIEKARTELGFNPGKPEQAVTSALAYLMEHQNLLQ